MNRYPAHSSTSPAAIRFVSNETDATDERSARALGNGASMRTLVAKRCPIALRDSFAAQDLH